jgi:hypothetical protein
MVGKAAKSVDKLQTRTENSANLWRGGKLSILEGTKCGSAPATSGWFYVDQRRHGEAS